MDNKVKKSFFRTRVRIVKDIYAGFAVQIRPWWSPVYFEPRSNTHHDIEKARIYAQRYAGCKVLEKIQ